MKHAKLVALALALLSSRVPADDKLAAFNSAAAAGPAGNRIAASSAALLASASALPSAGLPTPSSHHPLPHNQFYFSSSTVHNILSGDLSSYFCSSDLFWLCSRR